MGHTIVANNLSGGDCDGNILSTHYNIDGDGSCDLDGSRDLSGVDPGLRELADIGGPTEEHALSEGGPAIDGGSTDACGVTGVPTDQHGYPRPTGSACDIGAYEPAVYSRRFFLPLVR